MAAPEASARMAGHRRSASSSMRNSRSAQMFRAEEQREEEQQRDCFLQKTEEACSMPAKSAGSEDKRSVLPRGSVLQQNVTKLSAIAACSVAVQRRALPVGLGTMDDGRSLRRWRSVQGQYWVELQKVQHNIQHTLNKRRDSGRPPSAHSPTVMLEQMKERIHNIAEDMKILRTGAAGKSQCVPPLRGRGRPRPPKKKRRAQRKRVRRAQQACSDTIEETISSTDEAVAQRKRARFYKRSSLVPSYTPLTDTSFHLHITIFHSYNSFSHRPMHHECGTLSWSVLHSLGLKTDDSHESGQPLPASALLNNLGQGGYTGIRVGEAERKSRTRHARQRLDGNRATQRHSQTDQRSWRLSAELPDSVTRGVQNLHISDSPAAPAAPPAPPATMRIFRRPPRPKQQPREYIRCAQCGPDAAAHTASTDGGLEQLLAELRRASAMALPRCVVSRYGTVTSLGLCFVVTVVACSSPESRNVSTNGLQLWETGQISDLFCKVLGADRRTARATSVRLDSPRIHQQSREPRRALLIVAGTGLQLSSHGARALELIPPVRSVPRRRQLPGAAEGTNWYGVR